MAFWQRFGWGKAKTARAQAFEGARMARRLSSWRVGSEGINAAIRQGGDVLRARSRDLVRNNPYPGFLLIGHDCIRHGSALPFPRRFVREIEQLR